MIPYPLHFGCQVPKEQLKIHSASVSFAVKCEDELRNAKFLSLRWAYAWTKVEDLKILDFEVINDSSLEDCLMQQQDDYESYHLRYSESK